ncbi:major histocompatibility complex class I-related gene protein-like [Pantherophis guttatus]|uniref:Major histocompatibility complex class I-related gene protein-like n=1 Tax=Pantherophis guttatus TaxID=94885 RepID=A0A6P9C2R6_PANGU|nr:major histocompatibility complex class I-related gene protein-like [Pantherophis guttatus]XP_034277747.1 major histocompatibility complex class I-related gene protein-like [Pantherophis guttatus]
MRQPRAPLWLLGAVLGASLWGSGCGSSLHSLSYFYLKLPEPSQGLPQFFIKSYLDDQPIARFDSLTKKMEPLVPWMEEAEDETFLAPEQVFRADLEKLSKLDHQAEGLHTWQVVLGCELKEDGSKGGFLHYGYKGMDFISFDKGTVRWVTAQPQAQKVKEKWEEDPGWSKRNKVYLEETCIEGLQRYLSYKNKTLQKIEPPVGKVTCKVVDDSLEVLICQAFGFYPKEIQATWTKDGEVCQYETLHRNVVPNSDGTYYIWLSIEIDPKERDHFRCHLEHEGLQEPLVLAWKEETATRWRISVAASISGVGILFLIGWLWRRRRNNLCQEVTTCRDHKLFTKSSFFPQVWYRSWDSKTVVPAN